MLYYTLKAYQDASCIDEIIIVARECEIPFWEILCKENEISKVTRIIVGGATRQESVRLGLDAVSEASRFIAIADGARCLITSEQINSVCRSAYKYNAATAAHRSTDTVKIADKNGFIGETTDRNTVWLAATPQVFKTKLYLVALERAKKDGATVTDDNMLVERIRRPVRLVECGPNNIKITTRDDMVAVRAILEERLGGK
jgi:2-C-methyl-D-erythritol 4-phosphate cytidylyltransferase